MNFAKSLLRYQQDDMESSRVSSQNHDRSEQTIIQNLYQKMKQKSAIDQVLNYDNMRAYKKRTEKMKLFELIRKVNNIKQIERQIKQQIKQQVRGLKLFINQNALKVLQILELYKQKVIKLQNRLVQQDQQLRFKQQQLISIKKLHVLIKEQSQKILKIKEREINQLIQSKNKINYNELNKLEQQNLNNQQLIFDYRQQITKMLKDKQQYEQHLQKKYFNQAKKVFLVKIQRLQQQVQKINIKYNQIYKQKQLLNQRLNQVTNKQISLTNRQQQLQQNLLRLYSNIQTIKQQQSIFKNKQQTVINLQKHFIQQLQSLQTTKQYYQKLLIKNKQYQQQLSIKNKQLQLYLQTNRQQLNSNRTPRNNFNPSIPYYDNKNNYNRNNLFQEQYKSKNYSYYNTKNYTDTGNIPINNNTNNNSDNNVSNFIPITNNNDVYGRMKTQFVRVQKKNNMSKHYDVEKSNIKSNSQRHRFLSGDGKVFPNAELKIQQVLKYGKKSPKNYNKLPSDRSNSTKRSNYMVKSKFSSNSPTLQFKSNPKYNNRNPDKKLINIDKKIQNLKGQIKRQIQKAK